VSVLIFLPPLCLLHLVPGKLSLPLHGFLAFSAAGVVKLLSYMEVIRALQPHPSSLPRLVHTLFTRHTDARELLAPFFLTHLYLLIGCVAPLWAPLRGSAILKDGLVVSASGVLAVGLGDAAAAMGGTLGAAVWGKAACRPWGVGGGKKTVFGTLSYMALVASLGGGVITVVHCLSGGEERGVPLGAQLLTLLISVLCGALGEGLTLGVDNAVVPVLAWGAASLTLGHFK